MSIIGLKKANCKNCYRCVKVCPVKSIRVADGQATIIERSCILCGTCLERCPQNAKTLISHLDTVQSFLDAGDQVILSIAPSYYGCFHVADAQKFAGAVKALGFFGVSETSEGAAYVSAEYHKLMQENKMKNIVTTCCPSFNSLVEMYHPSIVDQLAPVVSPMIAHARLLKQRFPGARVVFCGPCIAKIAEAEDVRHNNEVDAVLTFEDLIAMFRTSGVSIETAEPASFLNGSSKILRMYPISEGILASLRQLGDAGSWKFLSVSGKAECKDLCLALEEGRLEHCVIEVNMCRDGCVNGPASGESEHERFASTVRVHSYAHEDCEEYPVLRDSVPMHKQFLDRSPKEEIPDEETIRAILAKIGKTGPEDELNCGSCGYPTCREKAIAVFQGKAELEMCVPYMKERAESFANCLLAETPNITIMVDEDLNIVEFNRAAEAAFHITRADAVQKCIYELMDPGDFEFVFTSHQSISDKKVSLKEYGIAAEENIVYVEKNNIAIGIFRDITKEEKELKNKYKLRAETMEMAQKVIDKQMVAAQQIASLLGETTAETKVTLTKLKNMVVFDEET